MLPAHLICCHTRIFKYIMFLCVNYSRAADIFYIALLFEIGLIAADDIRLGKKIAFLCNENIFPDRHLFLL